MEVNYFDLDQHRLDQEWIAQPKLFHQAAAALADARAEYERAKADRDLVVAELDREIRLTPTEFGLEKLREEAVANTILLQSRYKKALAAYLEAKHAMDVRQVEVDTLDHRKKALENLVQLWMRDYFAQPREPTDSDGRMADLQKDELRRKGQKRATK